MTHPFIFQITLSHDAGRVSLQVYAHTIEEAIRQVLTVERAPERSILSIERV
jgi:hypothetical protein